MKKPTVVIMAAGLGSRYGGLKQAEPVGPNGELLIDYSMHDAIRAGFGRVVCVIKRENQGIFEERIASRHRKTPLVYAYQELQDLPAGFTVPAGREKPWGTAHAVFCCRKLVREPFMVINADDYYGPEVFRTICGFLTSGRPEDGGLRFAMAGYLLRNTLPPSGTVARGVCSTDGGGMLTGIDERFRIGWADGKIVDADPERPREFAPDAVVSMNCWGFPAGTPEVFEPFFTGFLRTMKHPLTEEFMLPGVVDLLLRSGRASCRVLPVRSRWYGVTYREDHPRVAAAMRILHADGTYPERLMP